MDIFPTAKFQESLCRVTISIHCSYLRNQIINAISQVLPTMVASKLFMSDVDSQLNNDILDRMDIGETVVILRPKDNRYKDAIDLLGIRYKSGKIFIIPQRGQRMEMVLMCMVQRSGNTEEDLINAFSDFLGKALINFDNILERSSDFKLKCLEMEHTLSKSVPFSDRNQTHRIMQLISEISDDDPPMIYYQIMMLLLRVTKSDNGAFGIFNTDTEELKIFVSGEVLKEVPRNIYVKDKGFLFEAIQSNSTSILRIGEVTKRHAEILRNIVGEYKKKILTALICVTTVSMTKGIKIVTILINRHVKDTSFSRTETDFVSNVLLYASPIIHMANNLQIERLERSRTQKLLMVSKNIFSRMDNFDDLISNIMKEAQNLTGAEGCSLFLLDEERNELVSKVMDGGSKMIARKQGINEVRFPTSQGIAGLVATSGKMVNVTSAYEHPAFFRGVDEITGFKTKSILCFPIQNDRGKVVGVAQLCNKTNFPYFNKYDEDIAMAFSVFCHISIINSLIYKKIEDAQQRSVLANKVMTSHNRAREKISLNLIEKIAGAIIVPVEEILQHATNITAMPKTVHESDTIMFCMSMFERMDLIHRWRINRRTLATFLLSVKRGYRDVPYHNWYHAISVAHFVFACYMSFNLRSYLQEIENFVMLVAGFCHDIDHRGTNNSFQTKSKSVLASLYSSEGSMLEQHHFAQTVCILQTENSNIFESMDHKEYLKSLDLLRYIILATDLVHHFRKKPDLDKLATRIYKIDSTKDRTLLMCMLISSADLSDQCKVWQSACQSSKSITNEFLNQGDMEKELGNVPLEYMDRNKAIIPNMQISFIEGVVAPLFLTLATMFPQAREAVLNIKENVSNWKKLSDLVKRGIISGLNDTVFDEIEQKNVL